MENSEKQDVPEPRAAESRRLFWCAAIPFALLWTIVPAFLFPNFRLDIIEQFFVGQEWTFGSGSHPALTADLLDLVSRVVGITVAPSLCAALFNLLALWSIWKLAQEYLSPPLALAAALAMFGYWYLFQMEGTRYNNSVTLDASWIFAACLAFKAIETEKRARWFAAGAAIGVGLYFKYTVAILALVIVLFLAASREKRRLWRTAGPWISTFTAFLIFLPYLIWLFGTGFFASVTYAVGNAPQESGWAGHILAPLEFLSNQFPLVLPPLLCLAPILWPRRKTGTGTPGNAAGETSDSGWKRGYLNGLLFGPLAFNLIWSVCGGVYLRCDLGCHIWMPLTVWLLVFFRKNETPKAVRRSYAVSILFDLACLAGLCVLVPLAPLFEKNIPRYHFPGKEVAALAEEVWHGHSSGPLPWVTGEGWNRGPLYEVWPWLAGNVSVYGRDRARVYSGPNHCSWGTAEDVARDGGLFLWTHGDRDGEIVASMKSVFPQAVVAGIYTVKPKNRFVKKDVSVGIAVIPRPSGGPEKKTP